MTFSEALDLLKKGYAVSRDGWSKPRKFLELMGSVGEGAKEGIYISERRVNRSPWTPTQADLLANDWSSPPMGEDPPEMSDGAEAAR